MALFKDLDVWIDNAVRTGAEHMAVDEILHISQRSTPLLRIYKWNNPVVTFGYFEKLSNAKNAFANDDIEYVRRCTGGGIVDHRSDLTYTLHIPKWHHLSMMKGPDSYKHIHLAVLRSLPVGGCLYSINEGDRTAGTRTCFLRPVLHDIIGLDGTKLAGAGQKRSKLGLLHQGSVKKVITGDKWQSELIKSMSSNPSMTCPDVEAEIPALVMERYGNSDWNNKRP